MLVSAIGNDPNPLKRGNQVFQELHGADGHTHLEFFPVAAGGLAVHDVFKSHSWFRLPVQARGQIAPSDNSGSGTFYASVCPRRTAASQPERDGSRSALPAKRRLLRFSTGSGWMVRTRGEPGRKQRPFRHDRTGAGRGAGVAQISKGATASARDAAGRDLLPGPTAGIRS